MPTQVGKEEIVPQARTEQERTTDNIVAIRRYDARIGRAERAARYQASLNAPVVSPARQEAAQLKRERAQVKHALEDPKAL